MKQSLLLHHLLIAEHAPWQFHFRKTLNFIKVAGGFILAQLKRDHRHRAMLDGFTVVSQAVSRLAVLHRAQRQVGMRVRASRHFVFPRGVCLHRRPEIVVHRKALLADEVIGPLGVHPGGVLGSEIFHQPLQKGAVAVNFIS